VAAGGIAVDASGNAYVTGNTPSTDFPTANALQSTLGAGAVNNAFVTKLNANGSALVYSTYLGGSVSDGGNGIAVDSSGNANVTGATSSPDFPTANALQPTFGGGGDAFVTKINPSGSALIYSSYLGGSNTDYGQSIAVDTSGNAYVTGWTLSTNFPTANALQTSLGAGAEINAFVAKINSTGSALVYSTYLGGNTFDQGFGIAADSASNAYVTGATESTNSTLSSDRSPWRRMPS
jgi:Beta-propeller repeat